MWFLWLAIGYVVGMVVTVLLCAGATLAAWRRTIHYRRLLKERSLKC